MAYKHLRALMKSLAPPREIPLQNCNVVIDGKSFFKNSYRNSGCNSLLGGEYDRYADYLRNLLKPLIESNVTCFVIFNGCMDANIERRTEIHQNIIDRVDALNPQDDNAYCEPILLKDVIKEILTELGIKYYVTENDHRRIMLSVATFFQCAIITKSYEYSLLYNSCINPKSLTYDADKKELTCKIFECKVSSKHFKIKHCLLPLFFTLLDEQGVCFKRLTLIVDCLKPKHLIRKTLKWTKEQIDNLEDALEKIKEILTDDEWAELMKAYEANIELCKAKSHRVVTNYFLHPINKEIRYNDRNWFEKAVGNGRIPVSYINLTKTETFAGSWVIFDKGQEDAMLPALDIVFYVKRFIDFKLESKITFIGRQEDKSSAWEISKTWKTLCPTKNCDLFKNFLYEFLSGLDLKLLGPIPKEAWILLATLLYYCQKKQDLNFVNCVLLSYVMLGPVADKVGLIKRSHFMCHEKVETEGTETDDLITEDCRSAVESLMELFYVKKLKKFNRDVLQSLAEFQHCLQHMNYMNKMFGNTLNSTVYHKTLNATFVYNMHKKLEGKSCAIKYFEKRLKHSTVFEYFMKLNNVFEACMMSIELGIDKRMKNLRIQNKV